ncbi:VWA domain-containing protein [Streptomyces lasiicapitis]|uniref:VWA domain-containing protein n=1 Tax=Streptomyces lasiicapitis TaxID=1923961 RepID=UPI003323E647
MTPASRAAISLSKLQDRAPDLISLYKTAEQPVHEHGLEGVHAPVYLVLDRSRSMRRYYRDGTVQQLAERILALAAHFDDDGSVPLVFFSTDIDGTADVSIGSHHGRIQQLHDELGPMGGTNYHWAMDAVIDHHLDTSPHLPALVIFQTDGRPVSKHAAERFLCKAAHLPLFWQFVGFGEPGDVAFLRELDNLAIPAQRCVDNSGFFYAGRTPSAVPDEQLYHRLLQEFPNWLSAARAARILR